MTKQPALKGTVLPFSREEYHRKYPAHTWADRPEAPCEGRLFDFEQTSTRLRPIFAPKRKCGGKDGQGMSLEITNFIGKMPVAGRCTACNKWFSLNSVPSDSENGTREIENAYFKHACIEVASRIESS